MPTAPVVTSFTIPCPRCGGANEDLFGVVMRARGAVVRLACGSCGQGFLYSIRDRSDRAEETPLAPSSDQARNRPETGPKAMQLRPIEEAADARVQDSEPESTSGCATGQGPLNQAPSAPDGRLCFGILCEQHGHCARYLTVDGDTGSSVKHIGTCRDGAGRYPLFVDAAPGPTPAPTPDEGSKK